MQYNSVVPITRQEAESSFTSNDHKKICDALVRITYHDPDWVWVQAKCLYFCKHDNSEIRGLAATCIGHLARIHGILDIQSIRLVLNELLKDPEVSVRAQDALDDIDIYL